MGNRHSRDFRTEPFTKMVVLGESTVQGGPWLQVLSDRWPDILARLISKAQMKEICYLNRGIGASVISPLSPGYEASVKPSAMERYKKDVIEEKPDLFVMAYGLNDMRAGMDVRLFVSEMKKIISDVKRSVGDVVILLTDLYHMTGFSWYPPFDKGSREATIEYNRAIAECAEEEGCLFSDIWSALGEADWLVHLDGVHSNTVGNMVIAGKVFETLAQNCSCLTKEMRGREKESEWSRFVETIKHKEVELK